MSWPSRPCGFALAVVRQILVDRGAQVTLTEEHELEALLLMERTKRSAKALSWGRSAGGGIRVTLAEESRGRNWGV